MSKCRIYLASQIFAECWRDYNEKIGQKIEKALPNVTLYMPQRNTSINDKTKCATSEDICRGDFNDNLDKDDILVAIVDGDTPGIGTTVECGYFARICEEEIQKYGKTKKRIFALYTDTRECSATHNEAKNSALNQLAECQYSYINLLLVGTLKRYGRMYNNMDDLIYDLVEYVNTFYMEED